MAKKIPSHNPNAHMLLFLRTFVTRFYSLVFVSFLMVLFLCLLVVVFSALTLLLMCYNDLYVILENLVCVLYSIA